MRQYRIPMRLLQTLRTLSARVDGVVTIAALCALLAMLVAITLQIVFRVFFQALPWSEELSRYLLVWTTFLGATMAYRRGLHIAVTFLVQSFPPLLARLARITTIVLSLLFFSVTIWYAMRFMQIQSFQVSASMRLPMPYVYAVIPFSLAVMALHGLHALAAEIASALSPASDDDGQA